MGIVEFKIVGRVLEKLLLEYSLILMAYLVFI